MKLIKQVYKSVFFNKGVYMTKQNITRLYTITINNQLYTVHLNPQGVIMDLSINDCSVMALFKPTMARLQYFIDQGVKNIRLDSLLGEKVFH